MSCVSETYVSLSLMVSQFLYQVTTKVNNSNVYATKVVVLIANQS